MKNILLFMLCFLATFTHAQVSNGMIAKYSFDDGTAMDEIGNNDGTIFEAVLTDDRFGNPNSAYYFDGINDYLDIGSDVSIKPTTGSISVWVKLDTVSLTGSGFLYNPIFLSKNTVYPHYMEGTAIYFTMSDNRLAAITSTGTPSDQRICNAGLALTLDDWNHVVMTYDNDSVAIYLDGVLENKLHKGYQSQFDPAKIVYFAKTGSSQNDRYFNGALDDIQMYNRALNPLEVDSIYNGIEPITSAHNIIDIKNELISPNPNQGQFVVDFKQLFQEAHIEIHNTQGQLIFQETVFNQTQHNLNINLEKGMYFLRINTLEGYKQSLKLLIN